MKKKSKESPKMGTPYRPGSIAKDDSVRDPSVSYFSIFGMVTK